MKTNEGRLHFGVTPLLFITVSFIFYKALYSPACARLSLYFVALNYAAACCDGCAP